MFDKNALLKEYPEFCPKGYLEYAIFEGWYPILELFCKDAKQLGLEFKFAQIKEKFGGLRIYIDCEKSEFRDAINGLVNRAEKQAEVTCEKCGRMDDVKDTTGGWIKRYCAKCREDKNA